MAYEVLVGSVLDKIKEIESESVDSVITSPPYYGLRDYGTTEWVGGDDNCTHEGKMISNNRNFNHKQGRGSNNDSIHVGDCIHCGAERKDSQIGLEETPELYIQKMVEVFREVHRVLKPTGTVWLNIGDSYWQGGRKKHDTFKQKDLMMMPHRLAIALQDDGWYVRQDVIWYKTNPMPEPVKDRCTKSHEHIFLLTKNKKYYFDHENNRVPSTDSYKGKRGKRKQRVKTESAMKDRVFDDETEYFEGMKRTRHDVWVLRTLPYKEAHFAVYPPELIEPCVLTTPTKVCFDCGIGYVQKRIVENTLTLEEVEKIRAEIEVSTGEPKPYSVKEKEFRKRVIEFRNLPKHDKVRKYLQKWRKNAEMTIKEVELHFGDSAGHHWFEKDGNYPTVEHWWELKKLFNFDDSLDLAMTEVFYKSGLKGDNEYTSMGFVKNCDCDTDETKPAVILDIFAGSGTTGGVAEKHGRNSILIELNPEYAKLIPERIKSIQGMG